MQISENGLRMIAGFEGFSAVAYEDGGGVLTIGFGHTRNVQKGATCTRDEALEWLREDAQEACGAVNRMVKVSLAQNQFDALASFTYNVGSGNLASSTLLKRLNDGDYLGAAAEFIKWDKIHGVTNAGLLRRRMAERDLFTKPEEV